MTIAISAVPVPASDESNSLPIFDRIPEIARAPEPESGCKISQSFWMIVHSTSYTLDCETGERADKNATRHTGTLRPSTTLSRRS
ncbi:hypothetical protein B0H17DRAFT_1201783 [Mycena rosella]|uniref:Uncharacterized protein n=1 Tax=Mycena rosella TaxID=1033263 RepID=A0AAD7GDX9_MYCRO|nr:hypothetical protein B0H17DRAFT_1201783 [Mycena rosella]